MPLKPFLCFNCKPRKPQFGENAWEITLTSITILLFILSFVEMVAFAQYSSVFSQSEVSACCGVIEEYSFSADGANPSCHEENIKDSRIESQEFNGSVLCIINDQVCDEFMYHTAGNATDLELCLNTGGFPLKDVCGKELIQAKAVHKTQETAAICIFLCIIVFCITLFGVCEWIGCFEDSCWCQNGAVNVINKLIEIGLWCVLLAISQTLIENTAQNGYAGKLAPHSEARDYLYNDCELDNKRVLWVDFTLNMPEWLNSPGYQYLAAVGVGLSIIEFLLFFIVFDKQRKAALQNKGAYVDGKSPKVDGPDTARDLETNTANTIEMGDTKGGNTTNATNTANESEKVRLETGNEDMDDGGTYRDSDDDVLYDDEEKEMEYVTPGGPGDTPQ